MSINISLLLLAISAVESGGNPLAVGKSGERSQFQITEAVWKIRSELQFTEASKPDQIEATRVAHEEMIARARQLEAAGVPITPENLAYSWNAGARRAISHALSGEKFKPNSYAQRVANGYASALAEQPNKVPPYFRDVLPTLPKHL